MLSRRMFAILCVALAVIIPITLIAITYNFFKKSNSLNSSVQEEEAVSGPSKTEKPAQAEVTKKPATMPPTKEDEQLPEVRPLDAADVAKVVNCVTKMSCASWESAFLKRVVFTMDGIEYRAMVYDEGGFLRFDTGPLNEATTMKGLGGIVTWWSDPKGVYFHQLENGKDMGGAKLKAKAQWEYNKLVTAVLKYIAEHPK